MQAELARLHFFAGKLSLFALHFVGAEQSPAPTERIPKAPPAGADSPYQGEMSRRDKRGRDAGSRRLTERLLQICIEKPKPQIQFAVWKGRNEHRGKEMSLAAARSVVVISDAPPAALSFPMRGKR